MQFLSSYNIPISQNNIELIPTVKGGDIKSTINIKSGDADLTVLGYDNDSLAGQGIELFEGYEDIGNILFVSAFKEKEIDGALVGGASLDGEKFALIANIFNDLKG